MNGAKARNEDPTESFIAAESVDTSKQMNHLLKSMEWLWFHGYMPATDGLIANCARKVFHFKDTEQGLRSRRAEAVRKGLVERADRNGKSPTGHPCSRWLLTKDGMDKAKQIRKDNK